MKPLVNIRNGSKRTFGFDGFDAYHAAMEPFTPLDLLRPGLAMLAGAALLWFPSHFRRDAQGRHAARLAELDAGAEECFFEERRSLKAYRPAKKNRTWQLLGAVLFLLGGFQIFMLTTG